MLRKNIRFLVVFIILATISILMIKKTNEECSFVDLCDEISRANILWIILAVVVMPGFIFFEGMALKVLVKGLTNRKTHIKGMLYSSADIYFSAITPSASGGQPASAYFMMRDRIPGSVTTVILLVNLMLYSLSFVITGTIAFLMDWKVFLGYGAFGKTLVLIGIGAMLFLMFSFYILLRRKQIINVLASCLIRLGHKIRFVKDPEKKMEKLFSVLENYEKCSYSIAGKKKMIIFALIFNVLQRISQSFVTVFCYLAVGGQPGKAVKVWVVHMMASLGANSIPIPGGVGTTDYLLIRGLKNVDSTINSARLTLISRGISFYGCIFISMIIIFIGYTMLNRGDKQGLS